MCLENWRWRVEYEKEGPLKRISINKFKKRSSGECQLSERAIGKLASQFHFQCPFHSIGSSSLWLSTETPHPCSVGKDGMIN